MNNNLVDNAINQALQGKWKEAVDTNKEILVENSEDIDTLNRLARAYFELGDTAKAKKINKEVLSLDPTNVIALKSSQKYQISGGKKIKSLKITAHVVIDTNDFIEEVGTTKHTQLLNICSNDLASTLAPGDELILVAYTHKVSVTTTKNKYVGKIPDDVASKLRGLVKKGYKYKIIVKSAESKCIKVIIKEIKRGKGYEGKKSFANEALESY